MKNFRPTKSAPAILTLLALIQLASAQNCGCGPDLCCSQYGYCGTGADYCGSGCQSGPCISSRFMCYAPSRIEVGDIVTTDFFNGIANQAEPSCPGRKFYTRSGFIEAVGSYPLFGATGSDDDAKREIAAFFAHTIYQIGNMCYIEAVNGQSSDNCDKSNTQWPCASGKRYYGRGPLQLAWNYNYGPAGQSIGFDGLNNPELVATDVVISFKTALWFWMGYCHDSITSGQGFGATIRAVNGASGCDGKNPASVTALVRYYSDFCAQFRVDPGPNLQC